MTIDEFIQAMQAGAGEEAAQQFMAYGGDVNAVHRVLPLLHHAVEAENIPILRALFNLGADLEARDSAGWTVLHRAVDYDIDSTAQTYPSGDFLKALEFRMTEAVISLGADPSARAGDGRTPRDIAAESGEVVLARFDEAVARAQRME